MNNNERLTLNKMIKENNVTDQTDTIRNLKHSDKIKEQVQLLLYTKSKHSKLQSTNPELFNNMCVSNCSFLYENYTDIFNRIKKNELNLEIFNKFLVVLKQIENKEVDQHEGSFSIGKLLKELYIDSALKRSENLDKKNNKHKNKKNKDNLSINNNKKERNISWVTYKAVNLKTATNT